MSTNNFAEVVGGFEVRCTGGLGAGPNICAERHHVARNSSVGCRKGLDPCVRFSILDVRYENESLRSRSVPNRVGKGQIWHEAAAELAKKKKSDDVCVKPTVESGQVVGDSSGKLKRTNTSSIEVWRDKVCVDIRSKPIFKCVDGEQILDEVPSVTSSAPSKRASSTAAICASSEVSEVRDTDAIESFAANTSATSKSPPRHTSFAAVRSAIDEGD